MYDAVVVGAGPNGLSAAVAIASNGKKVLIVEGNPSIGGGVRSAELTLPGVIHDICSAVHPLAAGSPGLAELSLDGLAWAHPEIPMAHPLDGGDAAVLFSDFNQTAAALGGDGDTYRKTFGWVVDHWDSAVELALAPPLHAFARPVVGGRFGRRALRSATSLARRFDTPRGKALVAGLGAHAVAPLTRFASAGVALVLGAAAHTEGWPLARGGSQTIADALAERLTALGGEIRTGEPVTAWDQLPEAEVVVLDTAPETALALAGDRMSRWRARRYRSFPRGPAVFKIDVALSGPIPWTNEACRRAGTLHLGGTYEEIAAAERAVEDGSHPERPFVIAAQPVVADPSRAPEGTHVLWAYCHVPRGSNRDMTEAILDQVERFAPGARDLVVEVAGRDATTLAAHNPNLVGGDITGGALSMRGLMGRPTVFRPYRVANRIFLCSASTPPGAGAHGMCGIHAARRALRTLR